MDLDQKKQATNNKHCNFYGQVPNSFLINSMHKIVVYDRIRRGLFLIYCLFTAALSSLADVATNLWMITE
jgi:hypothetical protein